MSTKLLRCLCRLSFYLEKCAKKEQHAFWHHSDGAITKKNDAHLVRHLFYIRIEEHAIICGKRRNSRWNNLEPPKLISLLIYVCVNHAARLLGSRPHRIGQFLFLFFFFCWLRNRFSIYFLRRAALSCLSCRRRLCALRVLCGVSSFNVDLNKLSR